MTHDASSGNAKVPGVRRRGLQRMVSRVLHEQRGAQLVEFAILVPVLLLLIFGSLDFGRAYFSWIVLTNSAREGARTAAVGSAPDVVYDRVTGSVAGLPLAGGPELESCPPSGGNQAWCIETVNLQGIRGEPVTIRVEYNFRFLVPGLWSGPDGVFALAAESTMRLE